jgi:glycosyltransferase involved in cell wall biosynthesis
VLRTRDRPVFLRRALKDVLAQTFTNYSIVVVNDAGDLGLVQQIVAELVDGTATEVKIEHNEKSKGREAALNTGVLASKSALIAIHDDDDTWAPTFLERTVSYLNGSADLAVAVRTELVYEYFDGDSIRTDRRDVLAADKSAITLGELLRRNYVAPISLLYRREAHDEVGLYDDTLPVLADWDFLLRMSIHGEIGFLDGEPLAFWHQREGLTGAAGNSVVTDAANHKRYDAIIRDRYLRSDVARGGGTGALMYQASMLDEMSAREDARTTHLSNLLGLSATSLQQLRGELAQLAQLNQNLISQSNRMVAQDGALADQISTLERLVFSQTPRARLRAYTELSARYLKRFRSR